MDFGLDETHVLLRESLRQFCLKELDPLAARLDQTGQFPEHLVQTLAGFGLWGMSAPESLGGSGLDVLSLVLGVEEVARSCAGTALSLSVHNALVVHAIEQFGTHEQRKRWLPDLVTGKTIGCFCVTESEAGSDVAALKSVYQGGGSSWRLRGRKTWVTNGPLAKLAIVFARIPGTRGKVGITAFLVPMESEGIFIEPMAPILGMRAAPLAILRFESVPVFSDQILGRESQGFGIALSCFGLGRLGIAGQALGIAGRALDRTLGYVQTREQFGKPIGHNQGVQWMLAEMGTELAAARSLLYLAALRSPESRLFDASLVKWMCSQAAVKVTSMALQLHGGYGYIKEYPVERHFRDAKITQIYAGTTEMQKRMIAAHLTQDSDSLPSLLADTGSLTPKEHSVIKQAEWLATELLEKGADAREREQRMPLSELKQLAQAGFMALTLPESEGGLGIGFLAYAIVMRQLARRCASTAIAVSVTNMVNAAVHRWGTPRQKQMFLEGFRLGTVSVAAYALTEAGSGSDAASLQTLAEWQEGHYVLNGSKQFITSGTCAGFFLLFAKTAPEGGTRGISAFLVPQGVCGLEVGKKEDKMGLLASDTVSLALHQCRVPETHLLGEKHQGFKMALQILDGGRLGVAAQAVGIAEAAFETARQYCRVRRQFGRRLMDQSVVRSLFAEMRLKLEASWALAVQAATLQSQGKPFTAEASMAKWYATERANEICEQSLFLMGAEGLKAGHPMQRYLRDCRVKTLYEGTSEIQKIVIAKHLLKR
jgi:butyryl-CoA dehydrogenase